jgi:rfaE bifunctional protein nucleotidyltransferase chain/domain
MVTVAAVGCFDIFHYGHLRHGQFGRSLGDRLIVFLTTASQVNKGPNRPVFSDEQRRDVLLSLRCVDDVIINPEPNPLTILGLYKPDILIKGNEYVGRLPEQALVESYGGRVVFTDEPVYSSTKLWKLCECRISD